jgi:hypothetical protein
MRIHRCNPAVASLSLILLAALLASPGAFAQASAQAGTLPPRTLPANWAGIYTSSQTYTPKDGSDSYTVRYRLEIPAQELARPAKFLAVSSLEPAIKKGAEKPDNTMLCDVRVRSRTQLEVIFNSYADEEVDRESHYKKGDMLVILHRAETAGRIEYTATPAHLRFEDKHWIVLAKK